jgi:hypothetical protein
MANQIYLRRLRYLSKGLPSLLADKENMALLLKEFFTFGNTFINYKFTGRDLFVKAIESAQPNVPLRVFRDRFDDIITQACWICLVMCKSC